MRFRQAVLFLMFLLLSAGAARASSEGEPAGDLQAMIQASSVLVGHFTGWTDVRTFSAEIIDSGGRKRRVARFARMHKFVVDERIDGPEVGGVISVAILGNVANEGKPVFPPAEVTAPNRRVVIGVQPYSAVENGAYVIIHEKGIQAETDEKLRQLKEYIRTLRQAAATPLSRAEPGSSPEEQIDPEAKESERPSADAKEIERLEREDEKPPASGSTTPGLNDFDEAREGTIVGDELPDDGDLEIVPQISQLPKTGPSNEKAAQRLPGAGGPTTAPNTTKSSSPAVTPITSWITLAGVLACAALFWTYRRKHR